MSASNTGPVHASGHAQAGDTLAKLLHSCSKKAPPADTARLAAATAATTLPAAAAAAAAAAPAPASGASAGGCAAAQSPA